MVQSVNEQEELTPVGITKIQSVIDGDRIGYNSDICFLFQFQENRRFDSNLDIMLPLSMDHFVKFSQKQELQNFTKMLESV